MCEAELEGSSVGRDLFSYFLALGLPCMQRVIGRFAPTAEAGTADEGQHLARCWAGPEAVELAYERLRRWTRPRPQGSPRASAE